ncbi:hypothetical protein [Protofrankia symbiont of Coriaria ruscifolia]|uniref:Uncharacterized protein n=1 Tax=Candidatus Protofrankia californiensis TaxID=1839754 RepID=A0A1C3P2N2_9ACTN|nr:hypothetical protein [Protofrankia symbiont of Coriaria ruscifolia]SBW24040.1 hypothetical protein FDG2_3991 [Candidatus Protofrankia californiensis]
MGWPPAKVNTRAAQEFGVVVETAESARVAFADGIQERVHELGVEVVEACAFDR